MSDVAFKVVPGKAGNPPMGFAALDTTSSDVTIEWASATSFRIVVTNLPPSGVASLTAGTAIALTGTAADPIVNLAISADAGNTATTGSDSGLLVPPVDPASLISTDSPNALGVGTDGRLVVTGDNTGALSAAVINAAGLQVGDGWQQFLPADVGPWSGWEIVMSPAGGTVQVDILANGTPVTTGGSKPEITTGTSATGSTTGWAASGASAGDMLRIEVTAVSGTVEHVYLYLHP